MTVTEMLAQYLLLTAESGSQLVKIFLTFYGTPRFVTTFTSARHLSLSWTRPIQFMPPHPTSWRSILILSSHLRLGLPSGLFFSLFLIKPLYTPLLSPVSATCPANLIVLDCIARKILSEITNHEAFHCVVFSIPLYLVCLTPKFLPQHPILKHPQPTFLLQCGCSPCYWRNYVPDMEPVCTSPCEREPALFAVK